VRDESAFRRRLIYFAIGVVGVALVLALVIALSIGGWQGAERPIAKASEPRPPTVAPPPLPLPVAPSAPLPTPLSDAAGLGKENAARRVLEEVLQSEWTGNSDPELIARYAEIVQRYPGTLASEVADRRAKALELPWKHRILWFCAFNTDQEFGYIVDYGEKDDQDRLGAVGWSVRSKPEAVPAEKPYFTSRISLQLARVVRYGRDSWVRFALRLEGCNTICIQAGFSRPEGNWHGNFEKYIDKLPVGRWCWVTFRYSEMQWNLITNRSGAPEPGMCLKGLSIWGCGAGKPSTLRIDSFMLGDGPIPAAPPLPGMLERLACTRKVPATAGVDEAWIAAVCALPSEEQVYCVVEKLKELNPEYDGREEHRIENGKVTELNLSQTAVADLLPLRALKGLRMLNAYGTRVADLSPLSELPLTWLDIGQTAVTDLSPLVRVRLTSLKLGGTKVSDLSPLANLPLRELACGFDVVRDRSILRSIRTLDKVNGQPVAEWLQTADEIQACGIRSWAVVGPFDAKGNKDLTTEHPPEREVDFAKEYPGKAGPVRWQRWPETACVDLLRLQPNLQCAAYAVAHLDSPEERDAILLVGSDDSCRVWLNDRRVHEFSGSRGVKWAEDRVPIRLTKGRNVLKLKVVQGSGDWGFIVGVMLPDGKPVPGLKCVLPDEIR